MKYVKVLLILAGILSLILSILFVSVIKPIENEPFINYGIAIVLICNTIMAYLDAKEID